VRFRPDASQQVTDFELLARTHVNEECEPHYWRLCALSVCVCSSGGTSGQLRRFVLLKTAREQTHSDVT
jgi:hypothetical protein